MKTVYIHIGTHKTGTTTIQHVLRQNELSLKHEGFQVLPVPESLKNIRYKKDRINPNESSTIKNELAITESKSIISWEGFSGDYKDGYENSLNIASNLKSIFSGYNVYIVVYIRNQLDFIKSIYLQEIHEGHCFTLDEFLEEYEIIEKFDWKILLDNYSKIFGSEQLIVRNYDGANIVKDFGLVVESNVIQNVKLTKSKNIGYKKQALSFSREVNAFLDPVEKKMLRGILQSSSFSSFPSASVFDEKSANTICEYYADKNVLLNEKHGVFIDNKISGLLDTNSTDRLNDLTIVLTKMLLIFRINQLKTAKHQQLQIDELNEKVSMLQEYVSEVEKKQKITIVSKIKSFLKIPDFR
ncbi:hypothetical protein AB4343_17885 [Vibrio breoganii]|uniref:hypothetical protein n=1 Tax=Vibrio breoganii TaxID=553239 RepID=UPI000C822F50|nr:hypothetical protein [Vibrio breoganii]PML85156.1 hypothetical protein BCT68_07415 [Vibrio breoganii]